MSQRLESLLGDYGCWSDFVHRLSRSRAATVADGGGAGARVAFTFEEYCDGDYTVPFAFWGNTDMGLALAVALSHPVIMMQVGRGGVAYLPAAVLSRGDASPPAFVSSQVVPANLFTSVYRVMVPQAQLPCLVDWLCTAECPPAITLHDGGGAHYWSVMVARARCPAWRPPGPLTPILDRVFAPSLGNPGRKAG